MSRPEPHIFEVELPDGSILEIEAPETTPVEQIRTTAGQHWSKVSPAAQPDYKLKTAQMQSKAQFDLNRPAYSPGSAALGFVESFGVDPASPLLGTVKNLLRTGVEGAKAHAQGRAPLHAIQQGIGMLSGMAEGPRKAIEGYQTEDPNLLAEGVGQTIGSGAQIAAGVVGPAGPRATARTVIDPHSLLTQAKALRETASTSRYRPTAIPASTVGRTVAAARAVANPVRRAVARGQETVANALLTPDERLRTMNRQAAAATDEWERISRQEPLPRIPWNSPGPEGPAPAAVPGPPPTTPGFIRTQLERTRPAETPLELYERQRMMEEIQATAPREPWTTEQPIGAERPMTPKFVDDQLAQARSSPPATTPPNVSRLKLIEQGISPTAARAKGVQLFNADGTPTRLGQQLPELVPEIVDVAPGPQFDAGLMKGLRRMEDGIEAADALVPAETAISTAPIVEGLSSMAEAAAQYGNKRLANTLQQKANSWAEMGASIPWEKFRTAKRAFFKERNADINSATMRDAYRILMEVSEGVGGDVGKTLGVANSRYSLVRRVIDAAGLDPNTGRRPATSVGKVDKVKRLRGLN